MIKESGVNMRRLFDLTVKFDKCSSLKDDRSFISPSNGCTAWAVDVAAIPDSDRLRKQLEKMPVLCWKLRHLTMTGRILIIEDETEIADFMIRGLREEGFVVGHANNGTDGWNAMQNEKWDLILLDWWLPGSDGLTLLKQFRQEDNSTPVMFLTARDSVPDRVEGLDAGADDYLCKPFAFEELLARVRTLTRRKNDRSSVILNYDDLQIDLATHRVERGGNRLDLTSKEYALLVFFMRQADTVLSRNNIYEQVWEQEYDGISNTLEVHIKELRRKIELFGPRLIYTVRGQGYIFGNRAMKLSSTD